MMKNYALAALVALPALAAPAMAADLSTPQGVFDEQIAILDEFGTILTSTQTPEQMAAAVDMLTPRAKELAEAVKNTDTKELEALMLANKAVAEQAIMKLVGGIMKISMDPAYASSEVLQKSVEAFMTAAGGEITVDAAPGAPMM